ncbi:MAG: sensor histidine kinase [Thermoplasmatota archaeon]
MPDDRENEERSLRILLDLLSHDINNHVYGSTGYLELIEQMLPKDPTLRRYLNNSMNEMGEITHLVDNVRFLVSISHEPFRPEPVDLIMTLKRAQETASYRIKDKNLKVRTDLKEGDIILNGDRFLNDALVQVLTNSMKFDKDKDVTVELDVFISGDSAMLFFIDRGRGIPDNQKETVFTRFRRSIEEGDVHGRGMGLSVVKEVCERYGGKASIEDRIKGDHTKGTKVVLKIPLAKSR